MMQMTAPIKRRRGEGNIVAGQRRSQRKNQMMPMTARIDRRREDGDILIGQRGEGDGLMIDFKKDYAVEAEICIRVKS